MVDYSGFQQTFKCFSLKSADRNEANYGGKIILPSSALERISTLTLTYPLQFELQNHQTQTRKVHGGVLEFVAPEGKMFIPTWMMKELDIVEGDFVRARTVTIPKATYAKLQPLSKDFLDISNPKAVLENSFRNFSSLGVGESICVFYNKKEYYLKVIELKPFHLTKAASIIETDVLLDFAAPPGMEETIVKPSKMETENNSNSNKSKVPKIESDSEEEKEEKSSFKAFSGSGYSLNGKTISNGPPIQYSTKNVPIKKVESSDSDSEEEDKPAKFVPFGGSGYSLRK